MLRVDICTGCQLKCPSCPTAAGKIAETLGTGRMSIDKFKQLVAQNPRVKHIEVSNWGEIFLNKDLVEIMRHAFENGVRLRADNGVNLNHAPPDVLEAMVKYRFASLTCSIDGASPGIYRQYRVGGDLEHVIGNIRLINEFKKKHTSSLPKLAWQFVVFPHNAHEVKQARARARELGMKFFSIVSWDNLDIQVDTAHLAAYEKSNAAKIARRQKIFERPDINRGICAQLWNDPQINWDGRVLGCCVNDWGDFGNALDGGLQNVVTNERYTYAKNMLTGTKPARDDIPCTTCHFYHNMQKSGKWMSTGFVNRNAFFWRVLLAFNINAKWAGGLYAHARNAWYGAIDGLAERIAARAKTTP
jgi:MoaA/NifB/PqqE/SkfB family radical SAM enzyme